MDGHPATVRHPAGRLPDRRAVGRQPDPTTPDTGLRGRHSGDQCLVEADGRRSRCDGSPFPDALSSKRPLVVHLLRRLLGGAAVRAASWGVQDRYAGDLADFRSSVFFASSPACQRATTGRCGLGGALPDDR